MRLENLTLIKWCIMWRWLSTACDSRKPGVEEVRCYSLPTQVHVTAGWFSKKHMCSVLTLTINLQTKSIVFDFPGNYEVSTGFNVFPREHTWVAQVRIEIWDETGLTRYASLWSHKSCRVYMVWACTGSLLCRKWPSTASKLNMMPSTAKTPSQMETPSMEGSSWRRLKKQKFSHLFL